MALSLPCETMLALRSGVSGYYAGWQLRHVCLRLAQQDGVFGCPLTIIAGDELMKRAKRIFLIVFVVAMYTFSLFYLVPGLPRHLHAMVVGH
jgi:hypothetical protein